MIDKVSKFVGKYSVHSSLCRVSTTFGLPAERIHLIKSNKIRMGSKFDPNQSSGLLDKLEQFKKYSKNIEGLRSNIYQQVSNYQVRREVDDEDTSFDTVSISSKFPISTRLDKCASDTVLSEVLKLNSEIRNLKPAPVKLSHTTRITQHQTDEQNRKRNRIPSVNVERTTDVRLVSPNDDLGTVIAPCVKVQRCSTQYYSG